jgi:[ribosomal protein S5]-alanine N-acetyltransferase
MPQVVLETERLVLRQFTPDDLDALAELYADEQVMRYIGAGGARTREEAARSLAAYLADNQKLWAEDVLKRLPPLQYVQRTPAPFGIWAITLRDGPAAEAQPIGRCGLRAWDIDGSAEAEVGYVLARRFWGRGYATEAARAVRDFAFRVHEFPRVISVIHRDNVPCKRVAAKLGMTHLRDWENHGQPVEIHAVEAPR